jgi:hypothetical protein
MIGSIPVVFIEMKLKTGCGNEYMDAIAQVIAECNGQAYLMLNCELD